MQNYGVVVKTIKSIFVSIDSTGYVVDPAPDEDSKRIHPSKKAEVYISNFQPLETFDKIRKRTEIIIKKQH